MTKADTEQRLFAWSSITIMWASLYSVWMILGVILLILLNLAGVFMVLLQLPGTWLILLCTGIWAGCYQDQQSIGIGTLAVLLGFAILGEIVETFAGILTSRHANSSRRSLFLGFLGAISGAILGTSLIPVPLFGTLIGTCVGAGIGAMLGDRWAGRSWHEVKRTGQAAAKGRLWGTVGKLIIAAIMWLIVTGVVIF